MNTEYDEIITQTLNHLMELYECDDPLEALASYAKDYEDELINEIQLQGLDEEEALKKVKWEHELFEMECATDKEKSMVYNKVLKMLGDHERYLGRRIDDV